jgi:alkaline phosphatase
VPLFAFGPGSQAFAGVLDNTEVAVRIARVLGLEPFPIVTDLGRN